jgi:hypothetical protein
LLGQFFSAWQKLTGAANSVYFKSYMLVNSYTLAPMLPVDLIACKNGQPATATGTEIPCPPETPKETFKGPLSPFSPLLSSTLFSLSLSFLPILLSHPLLSPLPHTPTPPHTRAHTPLLFAFTGTIDGIDAKFLSGYHSALPNLLWTQHLLHGARKWKTLVLNTGHHFWKARIAEGPYV